MLSLPMVKDLCKQLDTPCARELGQPISVQDKTFNNWLNMAYQLVELQIDTVWFSINGSYPVCQYTSTELAVVRSKWT